MIPLPNKKYQVIYADPPWNYPSAMINPFRKKLSPSNPTDHYPTMSMKDIGKLPIDTIADDDCVLFLWVASPLLPKCIEVGVAWGFTYKTVGFVWHKKRTNPGFYTLSETELCLIFKKGRIPKPRGARNIRQLLSAKRGKHSQKPHAIRERIMAMFPEQDKIELFARKPAHLFSDISQESWEGWDVWGNES